MGLPGRRSGHSKEGRDSHSFFNLPCQANFPPSPHLSSRFQTLLIPVRQRDLFTMMLNRDFSRCSIIGDQGPEMRTKKHRRPTFRRMPPAAGSDALLRSLRRDTCSYHPNPQPFTLLGGWHLDGGRGRGCRKREVPFGAVWWSLSPQRTRELERDGGGERGLAQAATSHDCAWQGHTPEGQMATMEGTHLSGQGNPEQAALVRVGIGEEADLEPDLPHHPTQQ